MPRNGSGTMTVVNSFSPGTTISSSQVNANNTDIADELTNSLALDGQSTMSGQLKAADGTDTAPGITFGGDLDTGFYRSGTNTFKAVVSSGTVVATFGTSGLDAPTLKQNGTAVAVLGANTFTADQTITSTDAGQVGPTLKFYHNSASPAASDGVGYVTFNGKDAAGNETTYAKVFGEIVDTTDTSEDGRLAVQTVVAGSLASRAYIGAGLYTPNATSGDKGADTINASAIYDDGVLLDHAGLSGLVVIERKTGTNAASYDFLTGINSTYRTYKLIGWLQPATDDVELYLRISDDGSTWEADAGDYRYNTTAQDDGGTNRGIISTGDTKWRLGSNDVGLAVGNGADERIQFEITFSAPSSSALKKLFAIKHEYIASTGALVTGQGAMQVVATAAVVGVQFLFESGNIAAGDVTLYGVRNA